MAENSTASPKPIQSVNSMDPISQTSPTNLAMPSPSNISHSSPSIDIPQISSPSLPQISQQQPQLKQPSSVTQQQQLLQQQFQQQQHQNLMGMGMSGFQAQQGMQRSSSVARMNQIQQLQQQQLQQQQLQQNQLHQQQDMQQIQQPQHQQQQQQQQFGMLRQQAAMYGQMNFGRSMLNQQPTNQQEQQQLQHQQLQQQQQVVQQQPQQFQNQQLMQQQQLQRQQQAQQLQHQQQVQQQSQPQIQQQQQQPQQQQQLGGGSLSQSSLMGQSGHATVLPGQANPAQFNLLASPRQKANLLHGSHFQSGNSPGQPMQGMQALQMVGSLGFASQIRGNAPLTYGQQRINQAHQGQLRQLSQSALTSPQLPAQSLSRASTLGYMNPTLSALTQNSQQAIMQNSLSQQQQQQQWMKQMPAISGAPGSTSLRIQQRQLLQQQIAAASSSQLQQSMSLNPQQLSQLQQSLGNSQLQSLPQQQIQRSQLSQQHLQQQQMMQQQPSLNQQSPRVVQVPPPGQKSLSLTGSQPDATVSGANTPGGSSSQGTEASNQLLGKRKIQDLVSQVDAQAKLAPEVEDFLLEFADNFIDSVTAFACTLAKHRKSSTLEAKDVLLHLEKNWKLNVPGYSSEERRQQRDMSTSGDIHKKRLDIIHTMKEASHSDAHVNNSRDMMRQGMGNLPSGGQMTRPAPNSDQLIMQSTGSQMLQQMMRF